MSLTITGNGITLYHWAALKGAVKLEGHGLRHSSGRSATAHAKKLLGLKRNATRAEVVAALEAKIEEVRATLGPDDIKLAQ